MDSYLLIKTKESLTGFGGEEQQPLTLSTASFNLSPAGASSLHHSNSADDLFQQHPVGRAPESLSSHSSSTWGLFFPVTAAAQQQQCTVILN
jgi:hypothetical protein